MVLLMGISQHGAEGTSLVAIMFTALTGTRVNVRNRRVDLREAWLIGLAGLVFVPLGAGAALAVSGEALSRMFGTFIVAVGIRMTIQGLRSRTPISKDRSSMGRLLPAGVHRT